MIGNVFICLDEATYNSEIPLELLGQYARVNRDEEGGVLEILPTTFAEVGEDNKRTYGSVIEIDVNGSNHYLLELNCSWLNGEVSALLELGEGKQYPSNSLLTNKEAQELVNTYQVDESLSS